MKREFTRKLKCSIEVKARMEIEDPLDDMFQPKHPSSGIKKERVPLRLRKVNQSENLNPSMKLFFNISVSPVRVKSVGMPLTSREINLFNKAGFSEEMSYLKNHLREAVKEIVEILLEESRTKPTTFYKLPDDYEESEISFELPDEFRISKEWKIKELIQKIGSSMRKRLNPENRRRQEKSWDEINSDFEQARAQLQAALESILKKERRITKAGVAREMNIGSEKNRTASMTDWLKTRKLNWDKELAEARAKLK
jgi:hypothetical protein